MLFRNEDEHSREQSGSKLKTIFADIALCPQRDVALSKILNVEG